MAIDCSMENTMSDKVSQAHHHCDSEGHAMGQCLHFMQEVKRLAGQLHLSYSLNLKSSRPFRLHLTGLATGGRLHQAFRRWSPGYENCMVSEAHSFFPSSLLLVFPLSSLLSSFLHSSLPPSFLPPFLLLSLPLSLPPSLPLPPTFCFLPKPSLEHFQALHIAMETRPTWLGNKPTVYAYTLPTKLQSMQPTSIGGQGE